MTPASTTLTPAASAIAHGTPLVEARHLYVQDGQRTLLNDISLTIHAGEIVTLIGPNGAGKTTLVRALLGLLSIAAGEIQRAPHLRIGYVPQRITPNPTLPMSVSRFLRLTGATTAQIHQALTDTGVSDLLQQSLHTVSGGELQRVLLARALLRQPQWLVLDEPAQGVDISGQAELYRLIAQLRDRYQCGVLLVSHDLHLVMAATDTVICLNQHVCCHGHPEHVSQHPEYLQLFGKRIADDIAVYTHHHDHNHDVHGNIVQDDNIHKDHVHNDIHRHCQHPHHHD